MKIKKMLLWFVIGAGVIIGLNAFFHNGSFESYAINDFVDIGDLEGGEKIVVEVRCFLKAITLFEDASGNVVDSSDASRFLKENPRFDLTATSLTNNQKILFVHPQLFGKCQMPTLIDENGDTIYPLIFERGSIVEYRVVSQTGENKQKIVTYVKDDKFPTNIELVHDVEVLLYEDVFPVDEVVKRLEDGKYNSFQQVDWTGYIQIHLKGFNNNKWFIDFTEGSNSNNVEPINDLVTWLEIEIDKSTGSQVGGSGGSTSGTVFERPPVCNEDCSPATDPDNILVEFADCITTGDPNCYLNKKFYGLFVLGGAVLFGGLILNNATKKDDD